MSKDVLIVGSGSAGKRHAGNLRDLGCRVSCFDPRADRVEEAARLGEVDGRFTDFERAIADRPWDGVVIASPPSFHVDQMLRVAAVQPCPILSEKPLSIDAASAQRLVPHSQRILLGYTYRWWPPLQDYREQLRTGRIGVVRNMRFVMSAHLADWHPWERYQDFFMAQKDLGGGALLDESHFIDLMLWMLGFPKGVFAWVDKISDLRIDSDDNVEILVKYENGVRVNLHLDLIGRPHERSISAVGENGTLVYSYEDNAILRADTPEKKWDSQAYECERNDMFVGVARDYLTMLDGGLDEKRCTVDDGIATLKVVDACRESARDGRQVDL
jgi:predicted dehydrogenase